MDSLIYDILFISRRDLPFLADHWTPSAAQPVGNQHITIQHQLDCLWLFPICQVRLSRYLLILSELLSPPRPSPPPLALPDLNHECQMSVGTAGPQPRLPDRSGHCRTSTGRMLEKMSDRMPEDIPDRMPDLTAAHVRENVRINARIDATKNVR